MLARKRLACSPVLIASDTTLAVDIGRGGFQAPDFELHLCYTACLASGLWTGRYGYLHCDGNEYAHECMLGWRSAGLLDADALLLHSSNCAGCDRRMHKPDKAALLSICAWVLISSYDASHCLANYHAQSSLHILQYTLPCACMHSCAKLLLI